MSSTKLRVEEGQHTDYEGFDPVVKLALVITLLYPLRQTVYWSIKVCLNLFKLLSIFLGFSFDYGISDRPKWCWFQNFELPRYWLKRVD